MKYCAPAHNCRTITIATPGPIDYPVVSYLLTIGNLAPEGLCHWTPDSSTLNHKVDNVEQ